MKRKPSPSPSSAASPVRAIFRGGSWMPQQPFARSGTLYCWQSSASLIAATCQPMDCPGETSRHLPLCHSTDRRLPEPQSRLLCPFRRSDSFQKDGLIGGRSPALLIMSEVRSPHHVQGWVDLFPCSDPACPLASHRLSRGGRRHIGQLPEPRTGRQSHRSAPSDMNIAEGQFALPFRPAQRGRQDPAIEERDRKDYSPAR